MPWLVHPVTSVPAGDTSALLSPHDAVVASGGSIASMPTALTVYPAQDSAGNSTSH
jgi:hypothetical protein